MLTRALAQSLSERLLEAECARAPIPPLTDEHPELTARDAYRIQDALVVTKGEEPVGYKLGFTSGAMREQMGIAAPNYGRLTAPMQVDPDAGPIELSGLIQPRVEPEVAVLVEKDLQGPDLSPAQVYSAVRWAFGALEVVDTRFIDYRFRAEDNTADNSSAARFVLGPPISLAATDPRLTGVLLWRGGQVVGRGIGADALGSPLRAVAWLANRLGEEGKVLGGGSVVLTGGLTKAHPVGEGGTYLAELGGMGTVKVHFEREDA